MVHINFLNHFHIKLFLLINLIFINALFIMLIHKIQPKILLNSTSFNNNYNSIYNAADVFYPNRSYISNQLLCFN